MRIVAALLLFVLVGGGACLVACGGGGGGTPAPSSPFYGSYRLVWFSATGGPPAACQAVWGEPVADGEGGLTGTAAGNMDGVIGTGLPLSDFRTTVDPDLTFAWQPASLPSLDLLRGRIAADGHAGVMGTVSSAGRPGVFALARVAGTYGPGSLGGAYHACGFTYSLSLALPASMFGPVTFDGSGGGERALRVNRSGTIGLPLMPVAISYTVAADGALDVDMGSIGYLRGGVFDSGDFVLLGGSADAGENPTTFAMVRPSTTASAATLSGTYGIAGVQYDIGSAEFRSVTGTAVADGAGTVTVQFTENTEGSIVSQPPQTVTYTVDPDGELRILTGGPEIWRGGVSPTGDYAVLGGSDAGGTNPGFYVLVR